RDLVDYFRSEYLSRLSPGALRFLRRTAVLDRMCGALCDAILHGKRSARELVWYRYHHLFRDLLRRELSEREPDLVPVLHRRAADWFEAEGDPESALEHAEAAGDMERAARIITAVALPTYYDGRLSTVERWLSRFDDPAVLERFPAV